jgi:ligand-binding sensor protein
MQKEHNNMELTDILPLEKWIKLEQEINRLSGLDANVFNTKGVRISDVKNWANRLCPAIKDTDKGQTFICAVAHMNLAAIAKNTRKSVIEECDAGIVKLVVPIFIKDEFIGAFGACGLLAEDGEVDSFMINKTTGIDEKKIESLSNDIKTVSKATLMALVPTLEDEMESITGVCLRRP